MVKRKVKIFIAANFPYFARWLRKLDGYAISAHQLLFSILSKIASRLSVGSKFFAPAEGIIKAQSISGGSLKSGASEISYVPIRQSTEYERKGTPKTIHQEIYCGIKKPNKFFSESVGIVSATNLRLYGKKGWAFVTDLREVIEEVSFFVWGIGKSEVFRALHIPRGKHIGRCVAAVIEPNANNYTHWLLEAFPRLKILVDKVLSCNEVDKIIINHTGLPYQLETFRALKIPLEKIVQWQPGLTYFAGHWLIPTPTSRSGLNVTIGSVDDIRSTFMDNSVKTGNPGKFPRRIYISRKDANYRFVTNEDEIIKMLKEYGFEFLTLSGRSIYEQADIFKNAEAVIGLDSSGFTNTIFCHPGTKIIHIIPDMYFCPFPWNICSLCGLDYYYFYASGHQPVLPAEDLRPFFYTGAHIDSSSLQEMLDIAKIDKIAKI